MGNIRVKEIWESTRKLNFFRDSQLNEMNKKMMTLWVPDIKGVHDVITPDIAEQIIQNGILLRFTSYSRKR
jgi:hypothetical protein